MAKSKNHTEHNQQKKAHKHNVHKPRRQRFASQAGVCPKHLRNLRFARKGNFKAAAKKMEE